MGNIFPEYELSTSGHYLVYTKWMTNFMQYVTQVHGIDHNASSWDELVAPILAEFSAKLCHGTTLNSFGIHFENDEAATLFFLKFS